MKQSYSGRQLQKCSSTGFDQTDFCNKQKNNFLLFILIEVVFLEFFFIQKGFVSMLKRADTDVWFKKAYLYLPIYYVVKFTFIVF